MKQLLLGRLETYISEAGLTEKGLVQRVMQLCKEQFKPTESDHPLTPPSLENRLLTAVEERAPYVKTFDELTFEASGRVNASFVIASVDAPENITGAIDELLNPLFLQAKAEQSQQIRALVRQVLDIHQEQDTLELTVEYYLNTAQPQMQEPDDKQKAKLIEALEAIPIVQAMYTGTLAQQQHDANILLKSVVVLPKAQEQAHFSEKGVKGGDEFTKRAGTALLIYAALVEPSRRPAEKHIANFEIHPDIVQTGDLEIFGSPIKRARARSVRTNNKVCLSIMSPVPTIVHELGHQVEFYLPTAQWLCIHRILRMRQGSHPYPKLIDIFGNRKEGALETKMPAFAQAGAISGKYAAKVYASGDTEVMSMSLEYFCQPKKAKLLIQLDPFLAATILRAIRPHEFEQHIPPDLWELFEEGPAPGYLAEDEEDL
jgi:hypothetical protein